jgi:hypothetical protein
MHASFRAWSKLLRDAPVLLPRRLACKPAGKQLRPGCCSTCQTSPLLSTRTNQTDQPLRHASGCCGCQALQLPLRPWTCFAALCSRNCWQS